MAARRSYAQIAARRPAGSLGAAIAQGEQMSRTLSRRAESRAVLKSLQERPERIGPAPTAR